MTGFMEIGDRVWVARHEWYDVNITAVEGESGVLVVDTHASSEAAREVIDALRTVTRRPVTALVNTHDHFDHWFGNAAFTEAYGHLPITAHETCVGLMADSGSDGSVMRMGAPRESILQTAPSAIPTNCVPDDVRCSLSGTLSMRAVRFSSSALARTRHQSQRVVRRTPGESVTMRRA